MPVVPRARRLIAAGLTLAMLVPALVARAADPMPGPPLTIRRAPGPIKLDGDLSDPGWQGADPVTRWFEVRVGDSVEPQVRNVGYLAYDDSYFYAAFEFEDPNPAGIRAPLGDHDNISSTLDYGGVIIDSRNDGKSAVMFLSDPRGLKYDAVTHDVTGEDSSPDYFWEAEGRITSKGWNLEIRIPFSSLRYSHDTVQTWRILLYRNYPRDRRYLFFSAPMPRDVNCMVCNSSPLTGLENLPHGSHLVLAPFGTGGQTAAPEAGLGSRLRHDDAEFDAGLDLKWNPTANTAIDATLNPDFSQIESDAAQIVANERFALFFSEKRPFFLEGADLLSSPLRAVYSRTITEPRGGVRATGRFGSTAYTVLATQDEGGGTVVLPGPQGSGAAPQDFVSDVGIARLRRDYGSSFLSVIASTREVHGGGHNRVVGPDFNWRPRPSESITGQFLWSETRTPARPDLAAEWDGRAQSDHAAHLEWSHATETLDWYLAGQDIGPDFRDYNGFMPQVGYREAFLDMGYTIRPEDAFLSRVRFFMTHYADFEHRGNDVLNQRNAVGTGMDGGWNSFLRIELNQDAIRVGSELLHRFRPRIQLEASPGRVLNYVSLDTYLGQEIDFANAREAKGATVGGSFQVRPGPHLVLQGNVSWRSLEVDEGRLFTAQVERLRATWSFNSRSFLRVITQYVQTSRDTARYTFPVAEKDATLSSSALFAYKLNWQTVFYAGYGDERLFAESSDRLEAGGTQWFTKVSYALQR